MPKQSVSRPAFRLAISADERVAASVGLAGSPVDLLDRLSGMSLTIPVDGVLDDEVAAIALRPDGTEVSAVTIRDSSARWACADGTLRENQRGTNRRRLRSIAYGTDGTRLVSWNGPFHGSTYRSLAPDGVHVAVVGAQIEVVASRGETVASIDLAGFGIVFDARPTVGWSGDARRLAIVGSEGAVVWSPFAEDTEPAVARDLPDRIDGAMAVPVREGVLAATTRGLVGLAAAPLAPIAPGAGPAGTEASGRTDWTWNVDRDGYDGVRIEGEQLLWYRHEHNTMAGGGAMTQTIQDFVDAGAPRLGAPAEVIAELEAEVGRRRNGS